MEKLIAKQTGSNLTEAEAIKQAKEGAVAAFEFLYKAHCRPVYSLCLRMIKNPVEAEDLTQQAFLQLFRKIGTFRGESGFSTWLHRVTVNIVLMHLRRKKPMSAATQTTQPDITPARPPLPPFTRETAAQKVRMAEDGWNSRDAEKVALAYTIDSRWRNRAEFANGRREIIEFLKAQVGERAGLSANQGIVGLRRKSHRGALRVRMARWVGGLVPLVWQRKLGIR
jgi:RNA polymerase sigma factor (sigma-70 family)